MLEANEIVVLERPPKLTFEKALEHMQRECLARGAKAFRFERSTYMLFDGRWHSLQPVWGHLATIGLNEGN